MSIVLDEYDWAERMINNHDLGKKPVETLSRVSKYYYEQRYSKNAIRKKLDTFLTQCDANISLFRWSDLLDKIVKNTGKFPLVRIDGIDISKSELLKISKLKGRQMRRLAFTLLCIAKYWDAVSSKNNHWVNSTDKDIMKMSNIGTSIKRQSLMFGELRDLGLIKFSKKIDNLNVQVLFIDNGQPELHIDDFRNLGFQYLRYCGEPYFECSSCGIITKLQNSKRGRHKKYCGSCASEIKSQQNANSVRRLRNSQTHSFCV